MACIVREPSSMEKMKIVSAVLAGGAGSRMGGAKAHVELAGLILAGHVAQAIQSELVGGVGDDVAALRIGAASIADPPGLAKGPLAGVLAALEWGASVGATHVMIAPCDTPLLPAALVELLAAANATVACVETRDGLQPLVALWRMDLIGRLKDALRDGRHPPVRELLEQFGVARIWFEDAAAFTNINTREDLFRAASLLRRD